MTRFSVIIPAYNAAATIKQTLESCVAQSHKAYEIIIIDDCSTDETVGIINENFKDFNIQLISLNINKGVSNARNKGWDIAKGEYVAFLDADDIWHIDKLKIIDQVLSEMDLKCLGNAYTDKSDFLFTSNRNIVLKKLSFKKLLFRNYFNTSCLVVERNIGFRFNPNMRYTEDHELLMRISKVWKIIFVEANLTLLGRPQLSKGGLSGNKIKMRIGEIKMYREAARSNIAVFLSLPFLIAFSLLKHLKQIFRY